MTTALPAWKLDLLAHWEELGVTEVLKRAQMDYRMAFLDALINYPGETNPYEDHEWSVFQFPRLTSGVVHAAPKVISEGQKVLWEEWYFEDGGSHHNVLRNHEHPQEQKKVRLNDDEHPAIVMNIDWHYYDDSDRRPHLLR